MAKVAYTSDSTARKIYQDIYDNNPVLKVKRQRKKEKKLRRSVVIIVAIATLLLSLVMYRYAKITELNYQISSYTDQYDKLASENTALQAEEDGSTDLLAVEQKAVTFGMQYPESQQIVHISVPKENFVITEESEGVHVFRSIGNSICKLFDFLF